MGLLACLDKGSDDSVVLNLEGDGAEADVGGQGLDGGRLAGGLEEALADGCSDGDVVRCRQV